MAKLAVVALGGNAIIRGGQRGTYDEQLANARGMAVAVCQLREAGWTVVVVHGNGPQVGNLAVQHEEGSPRVPGLPLFVLGAMTEGQLGSLLALALRHVGGRHLTGVVCVLTHMVVDEQDPAFTHPTKPIGPFLSEPEARRQAAERGYLVEQDAGRGFRRMVASPAPLEIVELEEIKALVERGAIVIAAGGGGIPVVRDGPGYRGVEAVIDKDLAAQRLASSLSADALILVTDVPRVMLDYGTERARSIGEMTVDEAQEHADHRQFPEGSMGPKVRAAIRFLRAGGHTAVITNSERVGASLNPSSGTATESGTRIVSASSAARLARGAAR